MEFYDSNFWYRSKISSHGLMQKMPLKMCKHMCADWGVEKNMHIHTGCCSGMEPTFLPQTLSDECRPDLRKRRKSSLGSLLFLYSWCFIVNCQHCLVSKVLSQYSSYLDFRVLSSMLSYTHIGTSVIMFIVESRGGGTPRKFG